MITRYNMVENDLSSSGKWHKIQHMKKNLIQKHLRNAHKLIHSEHLRGAKKKKAKPFLKLSN